MAKLGTVVIKTPTLKIRDTWFDSCCSQLSSGFFLLLLGTCFYKALTALLGYFSILLEYIGLYHGFLPHSKKDNFGVTADLGGGVTADQGGLSPLAHPPLPAMVMVLPINVTSSIPREVCWDHYYF